MIEFYKRHAKADPMGKGGVDCAKLDVYVYLSEGGTWIAESPDLDGAHAEAESATRARQLLSHAIGSIVVHARRDKKPVAWVRDHNYQPPDEAIHRKFSVSI